MYTEATDAGPTAESGPAEDSLTEAADSPQKSQQQEQMDKTAPTAKYKHPPTLYIHIIL